MNPGERGTSLLELLFSLGLGLGVLAMVASGMVTHLRLARAVRQDVGLLEDLAWANRIFVRDMREAGLDPALARIRALGHASAAGVLRYADRDADGVLADRSEEHVAYSISGEGGLLRRLGRQSMSVLHGLEPDGVAFRFFDNQGQTLPGETAELGDSERQRVARVEVELEVRSPRGAPRPLRLRAAAALRVRIDAGSRDEATPGGAR